MNLVGATFIGIAYETDLRLRRDIKAVRRDGARVEAILEADYTVSFSWRRESWRLTVPAGFLAAPSVPPQLHGIVPFWGALFEASIVHDWCYWTRCFDPHSAGDGRSASDNLLKDMMRAGGADRGDCMEVYLAVRTFGGKLYDANTFKAKNGLARIK
jgi:hypothetical protein